MASQLMQSELRNLIRNYSGAVGLFLIDCRESCVVKLIQFSPMAEWIRKGTQGNHRLPERLQAKIWEGNRSALGILLQLDPKMRLQFSKKR